ncbi:MAG: Cytosolic copper metallochaperone [Pleopsidium flavum]|nr:MAG: Cytosolic copper metallochaperone [Pleopsidium flavum]
MAEHNYKFDISMSCSGCSGAVDRVIKRLDGIKSYNVSLENQTANVVADESLQYGTLLEKIKKTGKKVKSAEMDGQPIAVE